MKPVSSTTIDQGTIDRVSGRIQTYAQSTLPAANWFPPLSPLTPVAPKNSPVRALDYSTGVNLVINPRSDECVTYSQMRFVAQECTLVSLAVETRKDQMAKQKWDIRHRAEAVEGKTSEERKRRALQDARITDIRKFFRKPDREHLWGDWFRELVHEVLTTDAPAIYCRKTLSGDPYQFIVADGTTITRKIGLDGMTPEPPDVAYQQIVKGAPYVDLTTNDLVFRPRNPRVHKLYGYSPVEQVIFLSNMIMRRDLFKMNYYTEGNVPPALASVGDDWSADQIESFQRKYDAINQGDLAAMRRLQFIPKINSLHLLKESVLKDDADEWFARIVMYAFSLPPTALTKQMNRATAESSEESALDEGLLPLMNWFAEFFTELIERFFGYDDLEFVWTEEKLVDPKVQADVIKIYVDQGIMSRNQAAEKLGLDPPQGGENYTVATSNGPVLLSDVVLSTKDRIEQGLMADPAAPKIAPAPPLNEKPAGEPVVSPEKPGATQKTVLRNELAKRLEEITEDLHPELRDPVIVAKLAELERVKG